MKIQNVHLSYGGLLQVLIRNVGARPAGDVPNASVHGQETRFFATTLVSGLFALIMPRLE